MSTSRQSGDYIAEAAIEHVLTPISTAKSTVVVEEAEVDAELRAYVRFRERVAGLDTVSTAQHPQHSGAPTTVVETQPRGTERLRSAFRETVMSVDHYEEVYDEPLVEHAAAELSAEVAAGFRQETSPRFTELYKTALTTAVDDAIDQRETLSEQFRTERESLERSRDSLAELLSTCDGPRVPASSPSDSESRLDELARNRQRTIQRRNPGSLADGHALCQYLYQDCEWTYPVLTAVTRFRNTMV